VLMVMCNKCGPTIHPVSDQEELGLACDTGKSDSTTCSDLMAAMGAWYLQPPTRFTPFPMLVRAIAKRESRDVAANLRALATIKNTPEKLDKSYL